MTAYEMIVLREQGDRLAYRAHPSGQPSATFLSTRISASELVFENPAHDFPQEVGYRLDGDKLLGVDSRHAERQRTANRISLHARAVRRPMSAPHRTLDELYAELPHIEGSPKDAGVMRLIVRRPRIGAREVVERSSNST